MVWYFCCYLIFVISNVKLNALQMQDSNLNFLVCLFGFFLCSVYAYTSFHVSIMYLSTAALTVSVINFSTKSKIKKNPQLDWKIS